MLWVVLSHIWTDGRCALAIVQTALSWPDTAKGFGSYGRCDAAMPVDVVFEVEAIAAQDACAISVSPITPDI